MSFVSPQQVVSELGLQPGMSVADFGAGTGAITLPVAQMVTQAGKVYAVEVQRDFLSRITREAEERGLTNVEVLWGDIERFGGTKLANGLVDWVLLVNVLFQMEDIPTLLAEATRVLKPGGRIMVLDWSDNKGIGPHPDHIVSEEQAKQFFTTTGFALVKNFPAGDHHYGLIFKKI